MPLVLKNRQQQEILMTSKKNQDSIHLQMWNEQILMNHPVLVA